MLDAGRWWWLDDASLSTINSQGQQTSYDITNPDGSTSDSHVYLQCGRVENSDRRDDAGRWWGLDDHRSIDINSQGQRTSYDITNPDGSTDDSTYTYNADGSRTRTEVIDARRRWGLDDHGL